MKKGKSFVVIITIIAVVALILSFGLEQFIKINISQNEENAQTILRNIATACENYAKDHQGRYPAQESNLINIKPAYLRYPYHTKTIQGYTYALNLTETGYHITASPLICGLSGNKIYTITTTSILTEETCKQ